MNYSKIRKHIINKGYFFIYCMIILVSLLLCYSIFHSRGGGSGGRGVILALFILYSAILSLSYMLIGLYRCRNFDTLYKNHLAEHNLLFCKINIKKEDYKVQSAYSSHTASISPFVKSTNAIYLETDTFILLFFSIQNLGVFQQILKPFIFIKTVQEFNINDKYADIIHDFKIIENSEYSTIIFSNKYGIKEVIIPLQITP